MSVEDRGLRIMEAIRSRRALGDQARAKKRLRKERDKPWEALRDSWERFLHAKYGLKLKLKPWTPAERNSAKCLVGQYGLEMAERMAESFVERWDSGELPPISYLWASRDTWAASVNGLLAAGGGVKRGEYSAEVESGSPKHGW